MPHNYNLRSTPAAPAAPAATESLFFNETSPFHDVFNPKHRAFSIRFTKTFQEANIETRKLFDSLTEHAQRQYLQRTRGPIARRRDAANADALRAAYQEILEQLQEMAEDRILPEGAYLALSNALMLAHNAVQPSLNAFLYVAARDGDAQRVTASLDAGADVNASVDDVARATALLASIAHNHLQIACMLIERGAIDVATEWQPNDALLMAVMLGRLQIARMLIERLPRRGGDRLRRLNAQDAQGQTVLMAASDQGHLDIVNQLLAEGVSVNTARTRTENGTTALMIAVRTNHPAIVRALIESGRADINARDAEGNTALIAASADGHLAIVKQLLAAGAIVNAQNHDGDTALCFATDNNFLPGPARAIHLPAQHGWLCVNQLAAVAAVLREAGVNQLVAAAAALRDALPDTPPHY